MFRPTTLAIVSLVILVSGCTNNSGKAANKPGFDPATAKPVDAVAELTSKVMQLESTESSLETRVIALELGKDEYKSAWFDPTAPKAFQRVDANVGYFLVVLDNVQPYLDGQKITLEIGNPNNVTFSGFKINASWAARMPSNSKLSVEERKKAWDAFSASRGEKEIELTDTLRPGTWNKVGFVIAPVKAGEFGSLGIAISTNKVSLARTR